MKFVISCIANKIGFLVFLSASVLLFSAQATIAKEIQNPLMTDWITPHKTPPFHLIEARHFAPAIDASISEAKSKIDTIVANKEAPSFENTVLALELNARKVEKTAKILFGMNVANTSKELQAIAVGISQKLTELSNYAMLNEQLFKRVKMVYEKRLQLKLRSEQLLLLEKTYKDFIRKGANLKGKEKQRYREITIELSKLSLEFTNNVLADTNDFFKHITNKEELAGLPDSALAAAAELALSKGKKGWMFSLQYPSYDAVRRYAKNRKLRKEIYLAEGAIANKKNDYDNNNHVKKIANLRLELSKLLGYKNFAQYVLEERMAETPEKVNAFLADLHKFSLPIAKKELALLKELAKKDGMTDQFQAWDKMYYRTKLKAMQYGFNEEEVRPYFQLNAVKNGIYSLTEKLWGLKYKRNKSIPVYHPDVEPVEVYEADGTFLGVLYLDFYPRENKRSGAWLYTYRPQSNVNGKLVHAIASIVCNFTKPVNKEPALLRFDEVETFLHEFGHALHVLLSKNEYARFSGTKVYRDFVELPSQLMENWQYEKEWLDSFARHYKTGKKIPKSLLEKVVSTRNFFSATYSEFLLSYGMLDMAWHTIEEPIKDSVKDFELKATYPTRLLPVVKTTATSPSFDYIFAGSYAAGLYSYQWAEVLDADAYSLFKENGIFDKKTAESFRKNILERGGAEHPMILYKSFRGREPSIDALLQRNGLLSPTKKDLSM